MSLVFDKYRDLKLIILSSILIMILIGLFIVIIFCKFDFSDSYSGIVRLEDDYYVLIFIDDSYIKNIGGKKLVLNKKSTDYSIIRIDDEFTLTEFGALKGVYLKVNLDDKDKINNNILDLKFVCKKTILSKLKEML